MAERFGKFWLHEKLGQGGMAEVFRATVGPDSETYSFDVALKRLHPRLCSEQQELNRFSVEAHLAKMMVHPNIIRTYDSGDVEGDPYFAMEKIEGTTLRDVNEAMFMRNIRMPPDLAVHIAMQVLRALDYVHRANGPNGESMGIVHRDITPSNVHISYTGDIKIGDFGVAQSDHFDLREDAELVKGKTAYVAPEVLIGKGATQAQDIWSLGACLFEMLAGRRLHAEKTEKQIATEADRFRQPTLDDFNPVPIDRDLYRIVSAMLHPDPSRRPRTAAECYKKLKNHARSAEFAADGETLTRFVVGVVGHTPASQSAQQRDGRDPLTGVHSYRHMLELIQVELERNRRYERVFSMLFVDLDDFGRVNEEYGPDTGDAALRYFGQELLPNHVGLRSSDFFGRRSEDQFLIVLPETPSAGAQVAAKRIMDSIADHRWNLGQDAPDLKITACVGVATYPSHGQTAGALIEAAEVACFHAREVGAGRVSVASAEFSALKERIGSGQATPAEVSRWQELSEAYRDARSRSDPEQRHFGRVRVPVEVMLDEIEAGLTAFTDDIGLGGMRLKLPDQLELPKEMSVHLVFPGKTPVAVWVRVAWRRANSATGLEFSKIDPEAIHQIEILSSS